MRNQARSRQQQFTSPGGYLPDTLKTTPSLCYTTQNINVLSYVGGKAMAGQGNRVLISYNDVGKDAQLSSLLANRLAEHLHRKGKQPDLGVYRDSKVELQSEYDW